MNGPQSQRERVLCMLQEAGSEGITTAEFLQAFIPRFSARVGELRADGWNVTTERLAAGSFRYTLVESSPVLTADAGNASVSSPEAEPNGRDRPAPSLFDVPPPSYSAITGRAA